METQIMKRQVVIAASTDSELMQQILSAPVDESVKITVSSDLKVTSSEMNYSINYKKNNGVIEEFIATCNINSYMDQPNFYFGTICIKGGYIVPTLLITVPANYADLATNEVRLIYQSLL